MKKYTTDHCKKHVWVVVAVNDVGIWRDCKNCGTTGLIESKTKKRSVK